MLTKSNTVHAFKYPYDHIIIKHLETSEIQWLATTTIFSKVMHDVHMLAQREESTSLVLNKKTKRMLTSRIDIALLMTYALHLLCPNPRLQIFNHFNRSKTASAKGKANAENNPPYQADERTFNMKHKYFRTENNTAKTYSTESSYAQKPMLTSSTTT